jgi:hypothetical protein
VNHVAQWDGERWSALDSGTNGTVHSLAADGSGGLYAGGVFSMAGGVQANYVARWDGTKWNSLGSGTNGTVNALAADSRGNLFAGGQFGAAGGKVSAFFAHWFDPSVVSTELPLVPPGRQALHQNYPNPFRSATTIPFTLTEATSVRLVIYDLAGRRIQTLVDRKYPEGEYSAEWDGRDASGQLVSSGVYLCRIQTGSYVQTRRVTLLK